MRRVAAFKKRNKQTLFLSIFLEPSPPSKLDESFQSDETELTIEKTDVPEEQPNDDDKVVEIAQSEPELMETEQPEIEENSDHDQTEIEPNEPEVEPEVDHDEQKVEPEIEQIEPEANINLDIEPSSEPIVDQIKISINSELVPEVINIENLETSENVGGDAGQEDDQAIVTTNEG